MANLPCVLTTGELATYLGVARRTVSDWCDQGRLRCHRIPGIRQPRHIRLGDALAFALAQHLPSEGLEELAVASGLALARYPALLLVSPTPPPCALDALARFDLTLATSELYAVASASCRRYKAVLLDGALGCTPVAKALGWIFCHTDAALGVIACEDDASDWRGRGARWTWRQPADWGAIAGTLAADLLLAPPRTPTPPLKAAA